MLIVQAALTQLKELAAYPHLANGDYADVNREIKKIITKDSNNQVRRSRRSRQHRSMPQRSTRLLVGMLTQMLYSRPGQAAAAEGGVETIVRIASMLRAAYCVLLSYRWWLRP